MVSIGGRGACLTQMHAAKHLHDSQGRLIALILLALSLGSFNLRLALTLLACSQLSRSFLFFLLLSAETLLVELSSSLNLRLALTLLACSFLALCFRFFLVLSAETLLLALQLSLALTLLARSLLSLALSLSFIFSLLTNALLLSVITLELLLLVLVHALRTCPMHTRILFFKDFLELCLSIFEQRKCEYRVFMRQPCKTYQSVQQAAC